MAVFKFIAASVAVLWVRGALRLGSMPSSASMAIRKKTLRFIILQSEWASHRDETCSRARRCSLGDGVKAGHFQGRPPGPPEFSKRMQMARARVPPTYWFLQWNAGALRPEARVALHHMSPVVATMGAQSGLPVGREQPQGWRRRNGSRCNRGTSRAACAINEPHHPCAGNHLRGLSTQA